MDNNETGDKKEGGVVTRSMNDFSEILHFFAEFYNFLLLFYAFRTILIFFYIYYCQF